MKVLIVEDDPATREYLKDSMEIQGYVTRVAEDGLRGLKAYRDFQPDLVLSDIQMPVMDGLKLLEEIRRRNSGAIVVMITAFGCEDYAIKALRLKANNYLNKPVRHTDLLPLVGKYAALVRDRTTFKGKDGKDTPRGFTRTIENKMEMVPKVADRLVQDTGGALGETERLEVRLGLVELLKNAIEYGNLGITYETKSKLFHMGDEGLQSLYDERLANPTVARRKVTIEFKMDEEGCEWVISDEGKGFDWRSAIYKCETGNPADTDCKGIFLSRFYFDSLEYLGPGNRVRVRKLRRTKIDS